MPRPKPIEFKMTSSYTTPAPDDFEPDPPRERMPGWVIGFYILYGCTVLWAVCAFGPPVLRFVARAVFG